MSDRLTSPETRSASPWTVAALPAALLLIVLRESWMPASYETRGIHLGIWALFSLQTAAATRGMLPGKAPSTHTALAACLGALVPSWLLGGEILTPDLGWLLALAGWNFYTAFDKQSLPPKLLSGLCVGVAFTLTEETLIVGLPLLCMVVMEALKKAEGSTSAYLLWKAGLVIGLLPLFLGRFPAPIFDPNPDKLPTLVEAIQANLSNLPWAVWPFFLLGFGVSFFQSKKTVFGLLLPFLVLLPVAIWAFPSSSLTPIGLSAIAIWTAYGIYRVIRGIEQGLRQSNPKAAGQVPGIAIFGSLVAYAVWTGLLIQSMLFA